MKLLQLIAILVAGTLISSWVATLLWAWFITPLGAPEISMAHAYGLILALHVFCPRSEPATEDASLLTVFAESVVKPCLVFAFGSIAAFCM